MKKTITLFVLAMAIVATCATTTKTRIWESTSFEQFEKRAQNVTNNLVKLNLTRQLSSVKYVFSNDISKMSYETFKSNILKINDNNNGNLLQLIIMLKPCNKFMNNFINDPTVTKSELFFAKNNILTNRRTRKKYEEQIGRKLSVSEKRAWCNELLQSKKILYVNNALKIYENELIPFVKAEEILEDMKMAKRINYTNMTNNDWKPTLVKIELILKSIQ